MFPFFFQRLNSKHGCPRGIIRSLLASQKSSGVVICGDSVFSRRTHSYKTLDIILSTAHFFEMIGCGCGMYGALYGVKGGLARQGL